MSELALQLIAENMKTPSAFLDLGNCGLTEVPDEIGELVWLEELILGNGSLVTRSHHDDSGYCWQGKTSWHESKNIEKENNILQLNPVLKQLKNLKYLWLSGNRNLTDIGLLTNLNALQKLDVSYTQVSDLSTLLSFFERGEHIIYVEDCPLTNPPEAIVKQGNTAILNYFKEKQQQGTDHLYETKLLIVGAGGAGKTSLVRRLYQPEKELPTPEESTKEILIHQHPFKLPTGRKFRLNVWDFAGQEKYRPTDTFFFTQRSLYVLLDDTVNNDRTVHDEGFKYWLEAVDVFSHGSPVLLFQNQRAGRSKDIDFKGMQQKFNVKAFYAGDLKQSNAADGLREAIELYAKQLPHIGEALPAKWINIRAEIEQQTQLYPTISLNDYFKLYEKHLPFDRTKALHLSRYLHDLGVFLHYQDHELLIRTVILQNQWAIEAVFTVLNDESIKAKLGRFNNQDCERLWQHSDYADKHLELRALMEEFELCYVLQDSQPKTWLVPQLLASSKPENLNNWAAVGDLVLRYRYEFLPKGMINRLMVRKHLLVPHPELAWLTGVLFERTIIRSERDIRTEGDGKKIKVTTQVLAELSPQGNEIIFRARGVERKELLSIVSSDLETLNATFKGLAEKVTELIPCCCSVCKTKSEPEAYEKKCLLKRKQDGKQTIECPDSYENVNVLELLDGIKLDPARKTMKKIFISYSKHDNEHKDKLIKFLAPLRDNDKIVTWHDRDIQAGEEWGERIQEELNNAEIVLYLVSANSLATAYIQKVELPLIEQRSQAKQCKLVPVIVDFCDWEESWVAKYNALPAKGIPVTNSKHWINENQAWLEVIKGIKLIVSD